MKMSLVDENHARANRVQHETARAVESEVLNHDGVAASFRRRSC